MQNRDSQTYALYVGLCLHMSTLNLLHILAVVNNPGTTALLPEHLHQLSYIASPISCFSRLPVSYIYVGIGEKGLSS